MVIEFKKYSSIENVSRTKTINAITEQGLNDAHTVWTVSEKIHCSNFSLYITSSEIKAAKRSSFLGVGQNFFNFEDVLDEHLDRLKLLFVFTTELYDIEPDKLEIILYGELFGGTYPHDDVAPVAGATKVQRGVYYSPFNTFYAFDMKVNGGIINIEVFEELMEQVGFIHAKSLFRGILEECLAYPNEFQTTLPAAFGLPKIENNICEGVVIKPIVAKYFGSGSRVILKNKNEKFAEIANESRPKKERVPVDISMSEEEDALYQTALAYVTKNRLCNVISKIGEITDKMFGKLQGMFMKDVMEDFRKDHGEAWDALEKKRAKVIQVNLNNHVKELVRENFLDIIDGTF